MSEEDQISMPLLSLTTPRVLRTCKAYPLDEKDHLPTLFIASYPKSGTTWMQWIIYTLLTSSKPSSGTPASEESFSHISHFTPFYEIEKVWDFPASKTESKEENDAITGKLNAQIQSNHEKLGYHVFNTHLPYQWLPKSHLIKYIYLIRNSKDAAVSFFHHLTNQIDDDQYSETNGFSQFLRDFLDGKIVYGKWLDHLSYWLKAHENYNRSNGEAASVPSANPILLVQYERLVSNPFEEVQRIINFLGLENISEERLQLEILPKLSFAYMKQHLTQFAPISVPWKSGFEFIRKGKIGDHVNLFSEEEYLLFEDAMRRKVLELCLAQRMDVSGRQEDVNALIDELTWLKPFKSCIGLNA